ncbi:MAG: NADPH-dependent 7-cyano-7-deazaguanine reductase, partial [Elainellaceae cyanobacterium]
SGYPDFGTMVVDYQPAEWVVELKAFKQYINTFRQGRVSHETVVNQISDFLWQALQPAGLRVIGDFTRRGGVKTVITVCRGSTDLFEPYRANVL